MMLGWLRSQALRPFYDPDTGGTAAGGAGGSQADPPAPAPVPATGGTAQETAEQRLARIEKELGDTRKEAANYRTRLRAQEEADAEAKRKAAEESGQFKTLYEQAQAKLAEAAKQQAERERADLLHKVAKDAGLSEDLIDRLRGETEAELLADAKALAKRMAPTPPATGATNPGARRGPLSEDEQIAAMFEPGQKSRRSGMKW